MTTTTTTHGGALRGVLDTIAASRGLTPEGVAEEARRRGHDYTPAEILHGAGGFGDALDDVLDLDADERRRIVAGVLNGWEASPRIPSPADRPDLWPMPTAPGLARYGSNGGENPRTDGGPFCCVSHPAAGGVCGEPASIEVWALAFCEVHGHEAESAALAELWQDARREAESAVEGGRAAWRMNGALLYTLRRAEHEARQNEEDAEHTHEGAIADAYGDADDTHTDSDTLRYNGDPLAGGPVDWWTETRVAICKAMREAHEGGLTHVKHLEPLREYATVQEVLALRRELLRSPV
ncbi:MAG: hypothetical protein WKF67_09220 [Rubrobacteraceae bacterium]